MTFRLTFFAILFAILAFAMTPQNARAQFGGDAAPQFGAGNEQLQAILTLQHQLQLLKRLIEREKSVNDMVSAAIAVGVEKPYIPVPDKVLCAEVPANIPCAQGYTDLYPDFMKSADVSLPVLKADNIVTPSVEQAAADLPSQTVKEAVQEFVALPLYWTDITCLQTNCSAVISPDPANPMSRYRVKIGEKLPDGAIVTDISYNGVTLTRGKKEVRLDPAPQAS